MNNECARAALVQVVLVSVKMDEHKRRQRECSTLFLLFCNDLRCFVIVCTVCVVEVSRRY